MADMLSPQCSSCVTLGNDGTRDVTECVSHNLWNLQHDNETSDTVADCNFHWYFQSTLDVIFSNLEGPLQCMLRLEQLTT